jgi:hypothetical protein
VFAGEYIAEPGGVAINFVYAGYQIDQSKAPITNRLQITNLPYRGLTMA